MLTGVCVFILILYVVSLPIRPEIAFSADLLRNDGSVTASLGGVKIVSLKVGFCRECGCGAIRIKGKIINAEIHLSNDKDDKKSVRHAVDAKYFPIISVPYVSVKTRTGKADDALSTCVITSLVRGGIGSALNALVRAQKTEASLDCGATFGTDTLFVSAYGIIAVSVADIIYELIAFAAAKLKAERRTRVIREEAKI